MTTEIRNLRLTARKALHALRNPEGHQSITLTRPEAVLLPLIAFAMGLTMGWPL